MSVSRISQIQNEIRANSPGISPIIHENETSIVIRQPVTYETINSSNVINLINDENEDTEYVQPDVRLFQSRYRYYGRLEEEPNSRFLMPAHVVHPQFYNHIKIIPTENRKQSSIITIFSIWNTMMGTSILIIPWGIQQSGFACGIILLLLMAFLTLYTAFLITKCQKKMHEPNALELDFAAICRHYFGRVGEYSSIFFSLLSLICACVVYWILMSNFLYNIVNFIYERVNNEFNYTAPSTLNNISIPNDVICINSSVIAKSPFIDDKNKSDEIFSMIWNLKWTVPFYLFVFIFPIVNIKSPTFFTKFNSLGTITIGFLLIFIIVKASSWGINLNFKANSILPAIPLFRWSFPAFTGILSLAFFIHNCILSILRNQKKPENNGRDLTIAYMCVLGTFLFIGIIFYSSFPLDKSCISDNLLKNFVNHDIWAFVARIFLFLQFLTVFPLLLFILRNQVLTCIYNSIYPGLKHVLVLNLLVIIICLVFAIFFPEIGSIIRYAGSLCGLGYIFTLPSLVYMFTLKRDSQLNAYIIIIHVFIILIGLTNFIAQIVISFY